MAKEPRTSRALPKSNIGFDPERALEVAAALDNAHLEGRLLFSDRDLDVTPEQQMVEHIADPLDASRLLFYAIGTDSGVQSRVHYPRFRRAYDEEPSIFDPAVIASLPIEDVKGIFLRRYGLGMPEVVEQMHASSRIVTERFGADPRGVFDGIDCVHEAVEAIAHPRSDRKLPGFGPQVSRLLLKNFTELGLVTFPNENEATPKVDIHAMRIAIGTGILSFEEEGRYHSWAIASKLNEGYQDLCEDGRLDGRRFNSLLWTVGNRLCNQKDERACLAGCPLYQRFCTKLPSANYRASGNRNDGTIDTRIDDRKQAVLPFSLDGT